MHSFILNNFSKTQAITKIAEICQISLNEEEFFNHPDIINIYPAVNEKSVLKKSSLSIEQIRQLQLQVVSKPLKLEVQIVIVWQAQFLTIPAQNAFLKLLEEPHAQTYIFLECQNYQSLLPTIQSRCQIITGNNLRKIEIENPQIDLKSLYQASIGQRMQMISSQCPSQVEAILWLETLILICKSKLNLSSKRGLKSLSILLENCQTIYNDISKSNVNYKLALDILAIWWDRKIKTSS